MRTMEFRLLDSTEQGVAFYAEIDAHDLLVRVLVFE
jgi:hypothetical protein